MSFAPWIWRALCTITLWLPTLLAAQNLNTIFVSQTVPTSMIAGNTYPVSVTLKNTGIWGWNHLSGYSLGSQTPTNNTMWGLNRVPVTHNVYPGEEVTFNFNVTAPATAGNYNFAWRMISNVYGWYGATSTNVAVQVVGSHHLNTVFVSQNVPSNMVAGESYPVTVTLKNIGTWGWNHLSGYSLGSQNPQDNTTWGMNRVPLTHNVLLDEEVTFNFNVTAPATPGNYNFAWRMVSNVYGWYGATSANVVVGSTVGIPNAQFVSQNVPLAMLPGQSYAVSVTMQNNGNTAWSPGAVRLRSQNPEDNTVWGISYVELSAPVAPHSTGTFNFDVSAPINAGSYNFQWRLHLDDHGWLGAPGANAQIAVGSTQSNMFFVHVDHLNTPRLVANAAGQTVWRRDNQEPFNDSPPDENPSGLGVFEFPLAFPGQYADKETGKFYNLLRDAYDSGIGRYTQSDPIGLDGGINTYAYVAGNPLSHVDPDGLDYWIENAAETEQSCKQGCGYHQSVCVGKPNGKRTCIAFGRKPGQGDCWFNCKGHIYWDRSPPGPIEKGSYRKSDGKTDAAILAGMRRRHGEEHRYDILFLGRNCRAFADSYFDEVVKKYGGVAGP
jgi:RHS repeat-associated protein